jgi:tol-pal system protein YbgF
MTYRPLLMMLALTMLSGGIARAGIFDDEEARRQIAETRKRVDDVGRQIDTRIAALEATIKSQGLLDMFNAVEGLKSDIAGLRGQLEVLHNDVESTQKRQRDLYVDLDTRMRKMETTQQQQAAAAAAAAQAAAAAVPASAGVVMAAPGSGAPDVSAAAPAVGAAGPLVPGVNTPVPSAPPSLASRAPTLGPDVAAEQRAYDAALDQFKSGNYSASLQSFLNFVKLYPKSPLAPSAQYWVGNAHYALRDYRGAITSQRQLIAAYPDSQKVPDALLNISSSQIELGDTVGAKRTLEDLASRYPASEAADRAKKRLAGSR